MLPVILPGSLVYYSGERQRETQFVLGFLSLPRSALENPPDSGVRNEEELRLLLAAVMKDYMQMKTHELEQEQETEGSR